MPAALLVSKYFQSASTSEGIMWLRFLVKKKTGKKRVPFDALQSNRYSLYISLAFASK